MSAARPRDGSGKRGAASEWVRALAPPASLAAAAAILWFRFDLRAPACALGAVSLAVLALAVLLPSARRALGRVQRAVAARVGTLLTWILLGAVFVLCFVPGRLALAAGRRDPLGRRAFRSGVTAWIGRGGPIDPESYRRHY